VVGQPNGRIRAEGGIALQFGDGRGGIRPELLEHEHEQGAKPDIGTAGVGQGLDCRLRAVCREPRVDTLPETGSVDIE